MNFRSLLVENIHYGRKPLHGVKIGKPLDYELRKTLLEKERIKQCCRTKTDYLINKGLIIKTPCVICGSEKSEAHHFNYNDPWDVKFYCRKHHMEKHPNLKSLKTTY